MNPTRAIAAFVLGLVLGIPAAGAQQQAGGAKPSRTGVSVEAMSDADTFRVERDRPPIQRDFVQQPPLVPHSVKGYNITRNFNKCMDCHAWSRARETGATKVSLTHFKDRDGREMANVTPGRYFCTTCHVPQVDAKPLVGNTYQRADGFR